LWVEREIAIGIDIHAACCPHANFRPAVDREACPEIAARLAVATGEERILKRLNGVALAIELIAGRIDQRVLEREREAVVGQRLEEREHDRARGRLTILRRIRNEL